MDSTMMDVPLTVRMMYEHGKRVHSGSEVVTLTEDGARRATFAEVAANTERLANALARLGVGEGDRVGTFMWNNQEHVEAYFAIPSMGAVLHTLNIRLFPEQLAFVVNHAEDKVVIVDASIVQLLARVAGELKTVEHIVVVGDADTSALEPSGAAIHDYASLLGAEEPAFEWPEVDERSAAAMCYTSGTTGDPKGVAYSHRSTFVHAFAQWGTFSFTEHDRVLAIVPQFHVNAWGLPFTGWMLGADFVMPDRFLQAEPLCRAIRDERVTTSVGVPTVWSDILRYADQHDVDFSAVRFVVLGGAAVPRALIESFRDRHGLEIVQGWGMTETSPLGTVAFPPKDLAGQEEIDWRVKAGRIVPGVEIRIVDDAGEVQPWDGDSVGEIQIRGPWITGSYYNADAGDKFSDGYLRTGDVGTIDAKGFVTITDRTKDVIKSGGEWISSIDLENQLMAHPDVQEAAVVGVPDEKWSERPLACVVVAEGADVSQQDLQEFLSDRVAKWQVPERWAFVSEVPKTSVGKFDKKVLRGRYADGDLDVATTT